MRVRPAIRLIAAATVAGWLLLLARAVHFHQWASEADDGAIDSHTDLQFARLHLTVASFGLAMAAVAAVATLRRRLGRRWLLLQVWASTFGLLLLLGDHAHAVVLVPTGLLSLATCAASGLAVLVLLPWLRERERGAEPALPMRTVPGRPASPFLRHAGSRRENSR
ncbi:MAG: hypothetical protein K8J09_17240 [Planctomycetes bacterium]|nr:hypothetical protein [Planctomycetota bacterium]MCC7397571.1 hypothetical protein [Planctomycetota bacterium]